MMAATKTPKLLRSKSKTYSVCMLYNTNEVNKKLKNLSVAACNPGIEDQQEDYENNELPVTIKPKHVVSDKMYCNGCDCMFEDRKEQEVHYKSDWHRYNLRLKLGGLKSVKMEDFEKIANDVSSISGSEDEGSDNEEDSPGKLKTKLAIPAHMKENRCASISSSDSETDASPGKQVANSISKLYMTTNDGELISIFKCLLFHKKNRICDQNELVNEVKTLPSKMKWGIFMSAGGHFAGAIFHGNNIVVHKTFHRYVVRAKRGTVQSTRDSQGNAPKSLGASLRRHNEAALMQEIQDWMASLSEEINNCHFLFLRAPSFNKKIFYGGKNPQLKKNDERIRAIPFMTRRPTFNEVRRVHEMLSSVECYGQESELTNTIPISPMRQMSSETGKLEVVPESEDKTHHKNKPCSASPAKARKDKQKKSREQLDGENIKLSLPDDLLAESESPATETELVEVLTVITTDHLKEFEYKVDKPKKKSQKKKQRNTYKHQMEPDEDIYEEERYHLQNALYTACSTGDTQTLSALLVVLRGSDITPCALTPAENRVTSPPVDPQVEVVTAKPQPENSENSQCLSNSVDEKCVENNGKVSVVEDNENINLLKTQDEHTNGDTRPEKRTLAQVPNTLPLTRRSMRFGGYSLHELSPLVTVDVINKPFGDNKTTLLHVAAKNNHKKIIRMLMKYGADPCVKDKVGRPPFAVSGTKETRNEFRRFQAIYPEKYDYKAAQIPGPLTAEQEEEKKQKQAERKRLQKKAKAEKQQAQRELEAQQEAEEREKKRFLNLSDREKRLLAAERRLMNQCENQGTVKPVLSRCYGCGTDITGKVPFEYCDFKFCTTKCLREHRTKNS